MRSRIHPGTQQSTGDGSCRELPIPPDLCYVSGHEDNAVVSALNYGFDCQIGNGAGGTGLPGAPFPAAGGIGNGLV